MRFPKYLRPWMCCVLSLQLAAIQACLAQDSTTGSQSASSAQASTATDKPPLTQAELEQMVAPIALYPDPLLSQILMASTYPLEIIQADRWVKENKDLKGDALATALEKQTWDPSVKSLVNFPDVLSMMSQKLDLTVKLGDAMLDQQQDLMNTVQNLRAKAQSQGNLQSNQQQIVNVQAAPPAQPAESTVVVQQVPAPTQIIEIQPAQPDVIYVPSYSPTVVYGAWPYPAYPPYPYYPPGYVASNVLSFGVGVACGMAWGYAWGNCNWGHGDIDVDVNRNNNFNRNIDRSKFKNNGGRNNGGRNGAGGGNGRWQHNPSHRGGVPYANQRDAQRFGGANQGRSAAQAREQFRGRTNSGSNSPSAGQRPANGSGVGNGAIQNRGNSASQLPSRNGGANSGVGNRGNSASQLPAGRNQGGATAGRNQPSAVAGNRGGGGASVSNRQSSGGGAFGGSSSSGRATRAASQRGSSSRGASRGGGGARGGARGGGGGRRR